MAGAVRPGSFSHYSSIKLGVSGSTLWIIFCACTILGAAEGVANLDEGVVNSTNDEDIIAYAKPFITAENSEFGAKIDGTSVDSFGRVYAVDFQDQKSQVGQLSDAFGDMEQRLFFKWDDENSHFNGIQFFPIPLKKSESASAALLADKKGQVLQVLQDKAGFVQARVFCKDERMIEPNNIAVAYKSGRLYSTGLNYTPTTTHRDGDIWLCQTLKNGPLFSANFAENGTLAEAVRLKLQGRASGIEVSWDEEHLYASETWAKDMKIYSNVVWKYDIDAATGHLSNKQLFFDMKQIDDELRGSKGGDIDSLTTDMAANLSRKEIDDKLRGKGGDIDSLTTDTAANLSRKEIDDELRGKGGDIEGLTTDMAGNLYIVRNGEAGEVVKMSADGIIVKRIKLDGVTEPTNVELAGPHGTLLFVVGKCKQNLRKGCTDVWETDEAPGRAFFNLWRPALQRFPPVSNVAGYQSSINATEVPPPGDPS